MTAALEFTFWFSLAFIAYAYAGYALALMALAALIGRPVRRGDIEPHVSFIITARNEQERIRTKLENTLELDYPRDRLEIVVASDCSTDDTHRIVEEYAIRGVRLLVSPERRGKEFAQGEAIRASSGEILVFSDVATQLRHDGVRQIVASFADPDVGCVSSEDRVISADGTVSGEGAYVRYEMLLRALETRVGSVVGLSGSFFAARREVCRNWDVERPSDFTTLLNTLQAGMRGVSDPSAIGYYRDLGDNRREYRRKVRTIARGISAALSRRDLFNPFRYGVSAWQLFSHKVCRWLVPFAMATALASNLLLAATSLPYALLALAQIAVYVAAAAGIAGRGPAFRLTRIATFFVLANAAILHAWYNMMSGRQFVTWEPSQRSDLARP